jgi:hypothetical protein
VRGLTYSQVIDKYVNIKPNHSYYRDWTINKWVGSFGLGYLVLRELPLRNFYARCFVMWVFMAKMSDHLTSFIPYHGTFNIYLASDPYLGYQINPK